eukprot:scaffold90866_cov61-Phaeocystis_antarctica.AAC.3
MQQQPEWRRLQLDLALGAEVDREHVEVLRIGRRAVHLRHRDHLERLPTARRRLLRALLVLVVLELRAGQHEVTLLPDVDDLALAERLRALLLEVALHHDHRLGVRLHGRRGRGHRDRPRGNARESAHRARPKWREGRKAGGRVAAPWFFLGERPSKPIHSCASRRQHHRARRGVMGSGCSTVAPSTDANEVNTRAQVLTEASGEYATKIAALESKVSELQSSNQALELELAQAKSRVLAADRHAPSVAEGVSQSTSSDPAVAAGIIAVGSRLDKNNYVEEMATWARDPQQLLPKAVLLQANVAAVQAIGPAYLQQHLEQQQIDELTKAVEALKGADIAIHTKAVYQLEEAIQRKKKVDAKLAEAVAHVDSVKLASAEAISPGLARDGHKYTAALTKLVADERGVLDEVSAEAAAMVNVRWLKVGDEVEVVEGGAMQRAKVRRVVDQANGTYELSLWAEVLFIGSKYEAGFDTSKPKLVTLPRRDIYANAKHKQALSKEARALAAGRASAEAKGSSGAAADGPPPSTTPAYLALLYSDAERTLPLLHDLGAEINTQQPSAEPIVAPLKGEARAAFKTLDKYGGDRQTDRQTEKRTA